MVKSCKLPSTAVVQEDGWILPPPYKRASTHGQSLFCHLFSCHLIQTVYRRSCGG